MDLHVSSFQKMGILAWVLAGTAGAANPQFTALDALQAEWDRQPPRFSAAEVQALPRADQQRLERSLARIGAPGGPALLPPERETPTEAAWTARALAARSPQDRFTALFFLNRLKSAQALTALRGLLPADANRWPRSLHLEGPVAAAQLNGAAVSADLRDFLQALAKAGKADPVRAEAAHLRLRLAGLEPGRPALPQPPTLASLDAWNRGPWNLRADTHLALLATTLASAPSPAQLGLTQRLLEGLPGQPLAPALSAALAALRGPAELLVKAAALDYLQKLPSLDPATGAAVNQAALANQATPLWSGYLTLLRKHNLSAGPGLSQALLLGPDPLARAAAIEDLAQPPADLEPLLAKLWRSEEYDGVQSLLTALDRWKLDEPRRRALLERFSQHPCWTARLDAYRLLVKAVPSTPWPQTPAPAPAEAAILREAQRLVRAHRPVRLRLHFTGNRRVTLRLDPGVAPINVANLELLARRGAFNRRRVARVVPDFVVQMGSPVDTMDGGPGYTVRCENSLDEYGPGSVGMALSGKDTGGSQFFITSNAAPHLTGRYTRVGAVENPEQALPLLDRLELGARILRVEVLAAP